MQSGRVPQYPAFQNPPACVVEVIHHILCRFRLYQIVIAVVIVFKGVAFSVGKAHQIVGNIVICCFHAVCPVHRRQVAVVIICKNLPLVLFFVHLQPVKVGGIGIVIIAAIDTHPGVGVARFYRIPLRYILPFCCGGVKTFAHRIDDGRSVIQPEPDGKRPVRMLILAFRQGIGLPPAPKHETVAGVPGYIYVLIDCADLSFAAIDQESIRIQHARRGGIISCQCDPHITGRAVGTFDPAAGAAGVARIVKVRIVHQIVAAGPAALFHLHGIKVGGPRLFPDHPPKLH